MRFHEPNIQFAFCVEYCDLIDQKTWTEFLVIDQVGKVETSRIKKLLAETMNEIVRQAELKNWQVNSLDLVDVKVMRIQGWTDWDGFNVPF